MFFARIIVENNLQRLEDCPTNNWTRDYCGPLWVQIVPRDQGVLLKGHLGSGTQNREISEIWGCCLSPHHRQKSVCVFGQPVAVWSSEWVDSSQPWSPVVQPLTHHQRQQYQSCHTPASSVNPCSVGHVWSVGMTWNALKCHHLLWSSKSNSCGRSGSTTCAGSCQHFWVQLRTPW